MWQVSAGLIGGTLQAAPTPKMTFGLSTSYQFFYILLTYYRGRPDASICADRPYPHVDRAECGWSEFYFVVTLVIDKLTRTVKLPIFAYKNP